MLSHLTVWPCIMKLLAVNETIQVEKYSVERIKYPLNILACHFLRRSTSSYILESRLRVAIEHVQ